jgi:hypothetical protein
MRMSQAKFAVLILDCANTTVGRYETTDPPHGDLLLHLARIAKDEACLSQWSSAADRQTFVNLANHFRDLYAEEVREKLNDLSAILAEINGAEPELRGKRQGNCDQGRSRIFVETSDAEESDRDDGSRSAVLGQT